LALSNVNQVQAYPYYWGGNSCSSWYNYSGYCPYYSSWYYPYYNSWFYPYYYGYYYPYSYGYGYSYYSQPAQYQLTLNVNPSSLQPVLTGAGSYQQGATATFSANQSMIQVSQNTRYVFSHWSGDYSGQASSGTITMDAAKTVTAVYQLQYSLTVDTPANVPSIPGSGWYNSDDSTTLTVSSQIVGGTDSRLVFTGWNVDGNNSTTSPTLSVQMNAPHTVNAQYKQQYYITVSSDQGATYGTGWYDAGAYAEISATTPPSPSYGISMVFNGWNGSVESPTSQSTRVLVDGSKTVTATWRTDATMLYVTIAAVAAAVALISGVGAYHMGKRKQDSQVPTTPTQAPPQTPSNIEEPKPQDSTPDQNHD
jgi:hypothetical protein